MTTIYRRSEMISICVNNARQINANVVDRFMLFLLLLFFWSSCVKDIFDQVVEMHTILTWFWCVQVLNGSNVGTLHDFYLYWINMFQSLPFWHVQFRLLTTWNKAIYSKWYPKIFNQTFLSIHRTPCANIAIQYFFFRFLSLNHPRLICWVQ